MPREVDIIIIRGAPGSGKSQAAKSLAGYFPKGIRMEVDTLRSMIISVDWQNQQEHIDILLASTKLVREFLQLGFKPVIVVDTFSGDKINRYLATLNQMEVNLQIKIFGLFTTEDELKSRLEKRSETEFKDFAVCKKLNADVLKWKHENEFQVDTTGLTPTQTAGNLIGQLNS